MVCETLPKELVNIKQIEVTYKADDVKIQELTIKGLHNVVLQFNDTKKETRIKWFDEDGILRVQNNIKPDEILYFISELKNIPKPEYPFVVKQEYSYCSPNGQTFQMPAELNDIKVNKNYMKMAVNRMDVGDPFSEFIKKYNTLIEKGTDVFYKIYGTSCYKTHSHDPELNTFIRKISNPTIERETGNKKRNTFDFVRIRIGIPPKDDNRNAFVQKNMKNIVQIILHKLEENKRYQHYGVPTKYLKLDHATILVQDELELVFKLKGTD